MKLSLVVPVFNEEVMIELFYNTVTEHQALLKYQTEIIFVNDGSRDDTYLICKKIAEKDHRVKLLNFSRNFGKESALFAGLQYATGDVVIPIDVDLQDPIEVIPLLITKWEEGAEVVLAKRVDRTTDSFLKRTTASAFYKLHNHISDLTIEENVGDFRLMDKKVVAEVIQLPEQKLFMKGLLAWVGFKTEIVEYVRAERMAGTSKFNTWKLWNFALEGITSFSTLPLRLWTYIGALIALTSFCFAFYMILDKIFFGNAVPGYPSLLVIMLFLGGIQLIGIGVLGEYIGRIYLEVKRRPKYIISSKINC